MQKVLIDTISLSNTQNIIHGSLASALILKAYKNGIFIPKDATNGEVIQVLFPNINMEYRLWYEGLYFKDTDWWNAKYKTESEE